MHEKNTVIIILTIILLLNFGKYQRTLVCCLFFYFSTYFLLAQKNQQIDVLTRTYTPAQLQSDFKMLRFILEKAHPSLYWYHIKEKLQRKIDSTFFLLNKNMTEREFYQVVSPMLAQIHCGHTTIEPSENYQNQGKRLPLDFIFSDEKAYILYNYSLQKEIKIGANVLSINGIPIFEILQKILPTLSSDANNPQGKWADIEENFANYYDLIIEQPDTFLLTCQEPITEKIVYYKIPAKDDDFLRAYTKNYNEEIQKRKALSFEILKESKTSILSINSFLPIDFKNSKQKFKPFIQKVFKTIKKQNIQNLIIDLRQNTGGEMLYVNELFSYVMDKNYTFIDNILVSSDEKLPKFEGIEISKNAIYHQKNAQKNDTGAFLVKESFYPFLKIQKPKKNSFKGKIYILIGKKTFSAAALCTSLFYAYQRAIFVGEETGGGANGFTAGDFINLTLPETQLQVEIPIERWTKSIPTYSHKNKGIIPHYTFISNIEDILQNKDTTIDFVLKLINEKE